MEIVLLSATAYRNLLDDSRGLVRYACVGHKFGVEIEGVFYTIEPRTPANAAEQDAVWREIADILVDAGETIASEAKKLSR